MVIHAKFFKARRGQSRILEAVIAAVIIFLVFSVSLFLVKYSDVKVLQERADLDRLGYNVLHELSEARVIEETIENNNLENPEGPIKALLQQLLPFATYFNLTVYEAFDNAEGEVLVPPKVAVTVSNAASDVFTNSLEVSSTSTVYTSRKGNIYFISLILVRGGEA